MEARETQPRKNLQSSLTVIFVIISAIAVMIALSLKKYGSTPKPVSQTSIQVGSPAPDFTFPDLNGKLVRLSDHRGMVVLVNIWATWCPPCVDEMPSMQKLYNRLKGENFEMLTVSIDSTGREAVVPFIRELNLTFPTLLDPDGKIWRLYGLTGVPESFVVDKEGILVEKIIGPRDWASPEVLRFFQDLIEKERS
ncbi:MAG: TlpA family protein disulfide reductase [Deltaproteobacteria bacterium]|nr:MAG: TlpA family protein disulfide reductase [Deltaproteobacteria bacterium]